MAISLRWWLILMAQMALMVAATHSHDTTEIATETEEGDHNVVTLTTTEIIITPSATRSVVMTTSVTTHTINVGAVGHKFTPGETKAAVGDIIEWRFYPAEHWVIRADFDWPCIPYDYVGLNRQSFSSGPQLVNAITDDAPTFQVRVNDTEPIFFYCGAEGSCDIHHMVGVINPTPNKTLSEFVMKAEKAEFQLRPGDPFPKEGEGLPKPTNDSTLDHNSNDDGGGDDLSKSEIAGIVIGAAGVIVLACALFFFLGRRRRRRNSFESEHGHEHSRSGPHTMSEPHGSSPISHMTEWSQKTFGFGTQKEPMQRHSSPMPTVVSHSSPTSPQSATQLSYPSSPFSAGVGLGHGSPMASYYDPRVRPSTQSMAYPQCEPSEQAGVLKQQSPVELPTSTQSPDSPVLPDVPSATADNDNDNRFSWKRGPEIISRQGQ